MSARRVPFKCIDDVLMLQQCFAFVQPGMLFLTQMGRRRTQTGEGSAQKSRLPFYRAELDVLRFVAFLGVFAFHAIPYPIEFLHRQGIPVSVANVGLSVAHAGMYGVDLFFVLSAYLITDLLLREKQTRGALNIGAFYLRRILRIWPLYYFFIALAALVPLFNPDNTFSLHHVLMFLGLLGNWCIFMFNAPHSVAISLWSISVEEQFYLLWPPIVAKLSRRQIIFAAATLICVANISRLLAVLLHETRRQVWMSTFTHLDSIAAGILIANVGQLTVSYLRPVGRLTLILVGACFLVGLSYLGFSAAPDTNNVTLLGTVFGYPVVPVACAAVLVGFMDLPFRSRTLEYLGKISYGLYIYHLPGLLLASKLLPGGDLGARHAIFQIAVGLGITIGISAVSYRVLERPFLALKRRYTYVDSHPV